MFLPFIAIAALFGIGAALVLGDGGAKGSQKPPTLEPVPAVLEVDATTNWGFIPPEVRRWALVAEAASGLPGLARPLAVYWWSVWRGDEPIVMDPIELAELSVKGKTLCLDCFTPDARAAEQMAALLKKGYPKPATPEGWTKGAYGLGRVLGPVALYVGKENAVVNGQWVRQRFPLIELDAEAVLTMWHVQAFLGAVLAWRALNEPGIIVPDAMNTWGNVFAMISNPEAVAKGQGAAIKTAYLKRALEAGVDLIQNPAPTGKPGPLNVRKLWDRVEDYKDLPIVDVGGGEAPVVPQPPPAEPPPVPLPVPDFKPAPPEALPLTFATGLSGMALPTAAQGDGPLPMVVYLHERDSDVSGAMVPATINARAFAFRGQIKSQTIGYRYFDVGMDDAGAGVAVRNAGILVAATIRELLAKYPTTKLVVVGQGQGAAIALRLAEIGMVDAAVAANEGLPAALFPKLPTQSIVALVRGPGASNKMLPTLEAFKARGFATSWQEAADEVELVQKVGGEVAAGVAMLPIPAAGFSWTPECMLNVSSAIDTTRYLVPSIILQTGGKSVGAAALGQVALGLLAINDKDCMLVDKLVPADAASAARLYLVERQVVMTMAARGQISAEDAVQIANAALNEAVGYGAPPAELPQIEL